MAATLTLHTHDEGAITAAAVAPVNRKDGHVAATALAHGADLAVSNNRRLRREINVLGGTLLAVTGDEFAQQLLVDQPDGIDAVDNALAAKRMRRPVTRTEFIGQFADSFPGFAVELRH